MKYYSVFAQAYGQGNYGDCSYNEATNQCSTSAGESTSGGSSGGGLADTGIAIAALVTLACLIIFVSLVIRIWRRKPAPQEVEIQDASQDDEKRLSDRY